MSTRIQVRRDSTVNWEAANPTLAAGEIGYDTTKKAVKIGDGTRTWNQITYEFPYLTGDAGTTPDVTTLVVDQDNNRVGIGTGSPTEKLSVGGNAAVSGNITAGGTLGVAGNVAVNTSAFTVAAATGNTTVAGTLGVTGLTTLSSDLAINAATNADITTTTATATVFNTNATTLNIGGAATTVSIGASNGTTTIAGSLSAGATTLSSLALTTDLAIAQGGTGASDAAGARTNLGLLGMAIQAANAVAITGGTISGITDLAVADGGTGASDAAGARTNLQLVASPVTYANETRTLDLTTFPVGQWQIIKYINANNSTNSLLLAVDNGEEALVFRHGYSGNWSGSTPPGQSGSVFLIGSQTNQAQSAYPPLVTNGSRLGVVFNWPYQVIIGQYGGTVNVGDGVDTSPATLVYGASSNTIYIYRMA